MNPSLSLETTWGSALRAFCLGLVLLGFLPSLRAQQFGLFTYRILENAIEITGYTGNAIGHVEIPAVIDGLPVTSIGGDAFAGHTGLTSVTIPSSVTSLKSIEKIEIIEDTYYDTIITVGAFSWCTGLTNVTLEQGLTTIGPATFEGCRGLTSVSIPASVTSIGNGAFRHCTKLTGVTIPEGVTSIGSGTFYYCTGLTSVTIPSSVTSIGEDAFSDCTGLTSVTIPSSVTRIAGGAFIRCTGLTHVSIPSSVTSLGSLRPPGGWGWRLDRPFEPPAPEPVGAFAECTGLTSIRLSTNLTSIAEKTFAGCTGLTSITIPSSVTSIDEYAFSRCTGLTSVSFSEGLITIEGYAFSGCTGLTSVTIPSSVALIGPFYFGPARSFVMAFPGCTALTRAVFLGNAPGIASSNFLGAASGFTIYYLSSREGFTSPTWNDYPATMIDEAAYPAAAWLLTHGLWYDSDLRQDPDADGVNLLTAYALNLDPRLNLRGRLPVPVLGADTLSLNFHASTPGITYRAETSTNLTHWTTTGVTQTAPGADGRSTASVLRDAPHRFLRLMVQD